jgi:metal-responsive CopG/Arc/MetJ family transcriptional regulator
MTLNRKAGRPGRPVASDEFRVRVTSVSLYGPDSRRLEEFLNKVNQINIKRGLPKASRSDVIRRAIRFLQDEDAERYALQIAGYFDGDPAK